MFKNVTDNQGLNFAKMARAKGVSRQQLANAEEDGTIARFLDGIKTGQSSNVGTPLVPPLGGRIHIVRVPKLCLDREWNESINGAGPNTDSDWDVRNAGELYLPTGTGEVEEEHILLKYPSGGIFNFNKSLVWAEQFKLTPNDPRRVFAMAEQNTALDRKLRMNPMYVVAPVACTFVGGRRACYAWWCGSRRGASLYWTTDFDGRNFWFSFRK